MELRRREHLDHAESHLHLHECRHLLCHPEREQRLRLQHQCPDNDHRAGAPGGGVRCERHRGQCAARRPVHRSEHRQRDRLVMELR
ncbi:hypothetical protein DSECCO2_590420 [anaerobic digester metagenome]